MSDKIEFFEHKGTTDIYSIEDDLFETRIGCIRFLSGRNEFIPAQGASFTENDLKAIKGKLSDLNTQ